MAQFKIQITVNADTKEQAAKIASGLQGASKKVSGEKLSKMLDLLQQNPGWIDMASNFVK